MTKPDIEEMDNKKLFKYFSVEWIAGTIVVCLGLAFSWGLAYNAFASEISKNKENNERTEKVVLEQKKDIKEIKNTQNGMERDITQIKGDIKRTEDKIDLMLQMMKGEFDKR